MITKTIFIVLGVCVLVLLLRKVVVRLQLSRAKHRSLTGHSKMARRFASFVPFYEYDETTFFRADAAPAGVAETRRAGFMRLAALFAERHPKTAALTAQIIDSVSDLQFTSRLRVPFQFSRFVRSHFKTGAFVQSSSGVTLTDLDGKPSVRRRRFLRRQRVRLRLLQGMHGAGRRTGAGPWAGVGRVPSGDGVQRAAPAGDLGHGRNLLPHVRYRSGHAGGTGRALQHAPQPSGAFLRGLPWLVGRRAAGGGQSDAGA